MINVFVAGVGMVGGFFALVATGASGNLGHFREMQPPLALAVKFGEAGKGDMADIHVQPHADGIRRNQIINLTRLIHGDLRVARGRRQRAHDNGRTTACPPQHLGHRVDMLSREGDNGGARRQAG